MHAGRRDCRADHPAKEEGKSWQTGFQTFLDGKVNVYTNGCLDSFQQFIQFTETEAVRFIGPEEYETEEVTKFLGNFRFLREVPAGPYENQMNDAAAMSWDTSVGVGVRADVDEDTVYKITKAFWDNVGQINSDAPWAAGLDVN